MNLMENKLLNVAIYLDYENIHKTLLCQHKNLLRLGFFEKINKWCKNRDLRIVKMVAYCNYDNKDLHESKHQTRLQEYGINTIHTSNRGKNYADLQISIDALNDMYMNPNIDEFMIVSNDKDMSPLLNTIKANKRKATLLTVGTNYDFALCNVPDEHISLEEVLNIELDGELYIKRLENDILSNIESYLKTNFAAKLPNPKHLELEYYLTNQIKFSSIMEYELINILGILYEDGKILLYNYEYRGKAFVAIMPICLLDEAKTNHYLEDKDVLNTFDFELKISETYQKYIRNI